MVFMYCISPRLNAHPQNHRQPAEVDLICLQIKYPFFPILLMLGEQC